MASTGAAIGSCVVLAAGASTASATPTPIAGTSTVSATISFAGQVLAGGVAAGTSLVFARTATAYQAEDPDDEMNLLQTFMQQMIIDAEEDPSAQDTANFGYPVPAVGTSTVSATSTLGIAASGIAAGTSAVSAVGSIGSQAIPAAGSSVVSATSAQFNVGAVLVPAAGRSDVSAYGLTLGTITARGLSEGSSVVAARGVGGLSPGGDDSPHRHTARRVDNRRRSLAEPDLEEIMRPGIRAERERLARERELANRPPTPPKPDKTALLKQEALNNLRLLEIQAQREAAMAQIQAEEAARIAAEQEAQRQALARQRMQLGLMLLLMAEG